MFRSLSILIYRIIGWREENHIPKDLRQYIVVVAPHTSNWDFLVGLFARSIWRATDIKYLAKKPLFDGPLGWFYRMTGGFPVDRSKSNSLVDQVVEYFQTIPDFKIAITPEGTRKYVPKWKTGFWHIANQAKVPIILSSLDYGNKCLTMSEPFYTTLDKEKDIEFIRSHFRKVKGKNPEWGVK